MRISNIQKEKKEQIEQIKNIQFDWNEEKNLKLKADNSRKNLGFEDVVFHINNDDVLDIVKHPNSKKYPDQKILILKIDNYAYLVPYIEEKGNKIFLKTIIPSRKATKKYIYEE